MSYIVKSKKIVTNIKAKDINKENCIGNFYSGDRYYTLLNEYIDSNLTRKSKILACIIKFLFKSSNYKHDTSISNGRSIWVTLFDLMCVLFFIVGIILILVSVGAPLIQSLLDFFSKKAGAAGSFIDSLKNAFTANAAASIAMLVIGLITLIIGIFWMICFFRIRKKNKPLSLVAYVEKKISFILKLRWMIKAKGKTIDKAIKSNKEYKLCFINLFEQQGGSGPRWLNIQLINLLVSIFDDFSLLFVFKELSDTEVDELKDIFEHDFKNIELLKI